MRSAGAASAVGRCMAWWVADRQPDVLTWPRGSAFPGAGCWLWLNGRGWSVRLPLALLLKGKQEQQQQWTVEVPTGATPRHVPLHRVMQFLRHLTMSLAFCNRPLRVNVPQDSVGIQHRDSVEMSHTHGTTGLRQQARSWHGLIKHTQKQIRRPLSEFTVSAAHYKSHGQPLPPFGASQ